jgi:flagellar protein FlgJ
MLDQQMAQQLGASGSLGFAAMIEKQLGRTMGLGDAALPGASMAPFAGQPSIPAGVVRGAARNSGAADVAESAQSAQFAQSAESAASMSSANIAASPAAREFVNRVWPHAAAASRSTGIPAHFLVAQAALESGWGKSEISRPDGSTSHNLFGIKAGRSWRGESVMVTTTEYVDGVPRQSREKFRAYGSYAEAFADYANLLRGNERFSGVLGQQDGTQFARALQQSGYATDPMYADKLARIINGSTLRQALAG